jgi:hypothetical protein
MRHIVQRQCSLARQLRCGCSGRAHSQSRPHAVACVPTNAAGFAAQLRNVDFVNPPLHAVQAKQNATGGALSELIAMHCSQLRLGLEELSAALMETDTVKKRLVIIQELCRRSDVLSATESRHAATMSTVQARRATMPTCAAACCGRCEEALHALYRAWPPLARHQSAAKAPFE